MRPQHFAGVLGWPLAHTLSPVIHNAAFRTLGLEWVYLAWPVRPEELGAAVAGLRALRAKGANVTMPHKETVLQHLDHLSGDAEALGAVNTIELVGGELVGHNTDVDGFADFLSGDVGYDAGGRRVLVLGAGGAARAVVKALGDLGAAEIVVAARDRDRGAAVAGIGKAHSDAATSYIEWERAAALAPDVDAVVNATPLGMSLEDALPGARFSPSQLVVDLVYSPPITPLLDRARAAGASAWGGLGMLVCQAAASFRIWTSQDPPAEVMSAAAVRAIGSGHG